MCYHLRRIDRPVSPGQQSLGVQPVRTRENAGARVFSPKFEKQVAYWRLPSMLLSYGLAGIDRFGDCCGDGFGFHLEFCAPTQGIVPPPNALRMLACFERFQTIDPFACPERRGPQNLYQSRLREACRSHDRGVLFKNNQPCAKLIRLCTSANPPPEDGSNPRGKHIGYPTPMST